MLAWVDLEATGLVAATHVVLEIAAIATDDQLREVERFHRVVHWPGAARLAHLGPDSTEEQFAIAATEAQIARVVVEMHARSGLWAEVATSAHDLAAVDDQLANFFERTTDDRDAQKAQLAGSSIWLDRSFMAVHLPRALAQLHYRCVDVTTLNELARRAWPHLHEGRPSKREVHRAVPDIEDSLALGRYFVEQIARDARGSETAA